MTRSGANWLCRRDGFAPGGGTRITSRDWPVGHRMKVWMWGPRWRRAFGVERLAIADVIPSSAKYHRPGKRFWFYSLEEDIRERILEEIRPGVYAQWSDLQEFVARARGRA